MREKNLKIKRANKLTSSIVEELVAIEEVSIFDRAIGNSKNRTKQQAETAREQFMAFQDTVEADTLMAYTDGSVLGHECFGEGGCGIVMHTKEDGVEEKVSKKVGIMVDNVTCEVEGILTALEMVGGIQERKNLRKVLILSDCKSAIDILVGQSEIRRNLDELQRMWKAVSKAKGLGVTCKLIWIPGHADIEWNEEADRLAKEGCAKEAEEPQEEVPVNVMERWIKDKKRDRWNMAWRTSETGLWTKGLMGKIGKKLKFPRDRSTGVSYVRLLVNNTAVKENMFRFKLVDDKECECGEGIQSVNHVLMECKNEEEGRNKLKDELGRLWMEESTKVGDLPFDLRLILAPFSFNKINEPLANKMLVCSFKFLLSLIKTL